MSLKLGKSPVMDFNGYNDFSNYFVINHIDIPFPDIENTTVDLGSESGAEFLYSRNKEMIITVEITVRSDVSNDNESLESIRDEILRRITTKQVKTLKFTNYPDRYWNAKTDGSASLSRINPRNGRATLSFFVPKGFAYSVVSKTFTAAKNSEDVLAMEVVNTGSTDAAINYTIKHTHENGYIGIVSENGVIQIGDITELDTEPRTKSEWLIQAQKYEDFNSWTTNVGYVPIPVYAANGSWQKLTHTRSMISPLNFGTGNGYHGVTKRIMLPADSEGVVGATDWTVQFKLWFANSQVEGGGVQSIILANNDGSYRTGLMIEKYKRYDNSFVMRDYDGTPAGFGAAKARHTHGMTEVYNLAEVHNRFTAWRNGTFEISKKGKKVVWKFGNGGTHTINDSNDSINYTNITISGGGHGVSTPVSRQAWVYVNFRKDNVQYEYDVPNRYAEGSVLYVRGTEGKTYIDYNKTSDTDPVPIMNDVVKGSKYFTIPPSEKDSNGNYIPTRIEFYYSDFSTPPEITAELQEGYL